MIGEILTCICLGLLLIPLFLLLLAMGISVFFDSLDSWERYHKKWHDFRKKNYCKNCGVVISKYDTLCSKCEAEEFYRGD